MKLTDFTDAAEQPIQTGVAMHAHDRTMLAGLGFADPDKKNPQHDLACLYLTQQNTIKAVLNWLLESYPDPKCEITGKSGGARNEYHLTKGEGKYATTVGFIDVLFRFSTEYRYLETTKHVGYEYDGSQKYAPCEPYWAASQSSWSMIAEVKISKVGIGDILRQLNLYVSYFDNYSLSSYYPKALLIAPWDLTAPEAEALKSSGFGFLKLGKPFQDWQASVAASKSAMEL